MDKTSLAIALLVVIIMLMCQPQAQRPRSLGRMSIFGGIGLLVYYIVPAVLGAALSLWYGAVYRYGSHSVIIAIGLVLSILSFYAIGRQDWKENAAIRAGSQKAFDSRVSYLERHHNYTHERAIEAAMKIRDGDKKTDARKGSKKDDPPRRTQW
jgi:hypothetical protein